ncbi:hypothetical protein P5V15_011948 [Pogonomyrmex californicus]
MWKMCVFSIMTVLCVMVQYNAIYAKRILFISNFPSYSHQITYRGLLLELNRRGHEIVSVTTNPIKNSSLTNYTEIDLNYFYNGLPEFKKLSYPTITAANIALPILAVEHLLWTAGHFMNHELFKNPEFKKLYMPGSNEYFDAVIVSQGTTFSLNALAYRFNAPLIGISSLDMYNNLRYTFGSLILPSHISNWQTNTPVENNMSFWRRLVNFYEVWMQMYAWVNKFVPVEDALAKKYLGEDLPHISDIARNMSIYLVNRHPAFLHGKPEQPNVIYFHGLHIAKTPDPLPENIKQFLDDAKKGFIYMSLGTNVKWEELPNYKRILEVFVDTFCALPYRVIWKYDSDLLPWKCKNILSSNWFPQQSILAHPNIKLFIYQGGLQSTEEAFYYGIPLIGIPILWDQRYQVRNVVKLGIGVRLDYNNVSKEIIEATIHEVINNRRYKDRMEHTSKLYKDGPYDSLQNAVQWIEYVMRQNGTSFLRNSLCDEPWYQRYDWDIIGFFAIILFIASCISMWALYQILQFHARILSNSLLERESGKMREVTCTMFVVLFLCILLTSNTASAKRIFVIMVAPFESHLTVHRSLCLALHKRGHELVVLTTHPIKDSTLQNYTEIAISQHVAINEQFKRISQMPLIEFLKNIARLANKHVRLLFKDPDFIKFYNSNEKFDAIIIEQISCYVINVLAHKFNAPLIGTLTLGLHNYHRYIFGGPILSSHPSNWEFDVLSEEQPSIWQRLWNFIDTWRTIYFYINEAIGDGDEIAKEYFGNDIPKIADIMKNMSLMLVNEHPIYTYPRPEQPNVMFFSGIHIQKTPPSLPNDLGQFLDNATEGFIYVSFGTTCITCHFLPKEMLENFVQVFSKLPYKIVWKFECELPRKLDNVFISKWFLQQGVLAHPNIKLFITQGGLQSTEEAFHYAVPLLGIPIISEQGNRIRRLVSLGVAKQIKLHEITQENLNSTIHEIINNKSYKERMMYLSFLFKDRPYDSLENVIWWIEYVMRHKGINHLQFSESDKPWYERYDMDVIAFLSIILFIINCAIALIIIQIIHFILRKTILPSR